MGKITPIFSHMKEVAIRDKYYTVHTLVSQQNSTQHWIRIIRRFEKNRDEEILSIFLFFERSKIKKTTSKNCFTSDLWNFTRKISTFFWSIIAGYVIEKEIERFQQKNVNVAIKRVKSNAPALALSSDSNIDEVNHTKVSKNSLLLIRNVEFFRSCLKHIFIRKNKKRSNKNNL